MSMVNWGAAYYSVWITNGQRFTRPIFDNISGLPIAIIPAGQDQALLAAALQAE